MNKKNDQNTKTQNEGPQLFAASILQNIDLKKLKPGSSTKTTVKPNKKVSKKSNQGNQQKPSSNNKLAKSPPQAPKTQSDSKLLSKNENNSKLPTSSAKQTLSSADLPRDKKAISRLDLQKDANYSKKPTSVPPNTKPEPKPINATTEPKSSKSKAEAIEAKSQKSAKPETKPQKNTNPEAKPQKNTKPEPKPSKTKPEAKSSKTKPEAKPSKTKPETKPSKTNSNVPKTPSKSNNKKKRGCCKCCKKKKKPAAKSSKPENPNKPKYKDTCCNKLCIILWLIIIFGICLELNLILNKCEGMEYSFTLGPVLPRNIAIILTYTYIAAVCFMCLVFIILMKLGVHQKCCGICKEIILIIHVIAGIFLAFFIYFLRRSDAYGPFERDCLKNCLIYVILMFLMGVIAYVVFTLAFRNLRQLNRPPRQGMDRPYLTPYISSIGPCRDTYQMQSKYVSSYRQMDSLNNNVGGYAFNSRTPCGPSYNAVTNYASTYRATTGFSQGSNFEYRPPQSNTHPGCKQESSAPPESKFHVFVNVFTARPF